MDKKEGKNATRFNSKLYDHKLFLDPPKYVQQPLNPGKTICCYFDITVYLMFPQLLPQDQKPKKEN